MLRTLLRVPLVYPLAALVFARRVVVVGWSMHPTLAPGERVLFDTLAYRLQRPQRGDVVLARHPAPPPAKLVKRVAAVPGDRVTLGDGGWRVEEASRRHARPLGAGAAPAQARTLGEDGYFLIGDAPDLSTDARHFGPTPRRDILARAWMVYWPPHAMRRVGPSQPQEITG